MIVRKGLPRIARGAVIPADRAPRALAEVRSPLFPVADPLTRFIGPALFSGHAIVSGIRNQRHNAIPPSRPALLFTTRARRPSGKSMRAALPPPTCSRS